MDGPARYGGSQEFGGRGDLKADAAVMVDRGGFGGVEAGATGARMEQCAFCWWKTTRICSAC